MAVTPLVVAADRIVKATLEEAFPDPDTDVQYVVFFEEICDHDQDVHHEPSLSIFIALQVPSLHAGELVQAICSWGLPLNEALNTDTLIRSVHEHAQGLIFQRMAYLEDDVAALTGPEAEEPPAS